MRLIIIPFFIVSCCTIFFSFSYENAFSEDPLPCVNKAFPICLQIIQDSLGNDATTIVRAREVLDSLNDVFEPICVSFYIFDTRIIPNHSFDEINKNGEYEELISVYNRPNRINLYVGSTFNNNPYRPGFSTYNGITLPSTAFPAISINKSAFGQIQLAHFMGEYFGLQPTSYDGNGEELADGSNCTTAGDLFCDTPADPFYVPENGNLTNQDPFYQAPCKFIYTGKDSNNSFFNPDVSNIMSFYLGCRCTLTEQQYIHMAETYLANPGNTW